MTHASALMGSLAQTAVPHRIAVVLVSASAPALVLGPAAIGVTFPVSLLILAAMVRPSAWWPAARDAATTPAGLVLALVVLCWLPSLVRSPDLALTVEALGGTFGMVAAATALWAMLTTLRCHHDLMRKALVVAALIAVSLALSSFLIADEILSVIRFQGWVPSVPADRLKAFANAAALLVPAVIWSAWRFGTVWRAFAVLYAIATLLLVGLAKTHAPLVALLSASAFAGVVVSARSGRRPAIVSAAAVAFAVVAATVAVLVATYAPENGVGVDTYLPPWLVDPHRQFIWSFTFDVALTKPLLGYGINTINLVEGAGRHVAGLSPHAEYLPSHPHNWLLEILAETGLVGALPALVFVALLLTGFARAFIRGGDDAVLAAGCTSAAYWAAGLFNFSFWAAWWQLAHMVLLALILSQRALTTDPQSPPAA
ncbi:MAG: O-antigen ligase family protein [Rhodospirillales bacterium]|nr:O-antigen ligase family protein [Rhodospirillales bacterium]